MSHNIKIKNTVFNQTGYNCLEIGLTGSDPETVTIENCDFRGTLSNNAILIFGHTENATIKIKNCHFADVSNCVRISNKSNTKGLTVLFENCVCDSWEKRISNDYYKIWNGFLLFEDFTSKSLAKEKENNLYSPEKIKVTFKNCFGPNRTVDETGETPVVTDNGHKLISLANYGGSLAEMCGSLSGNNQVILVGNDCDNESPNGVLPYGDGSRYPKIQFANSSFDDEEAEANKIIASIQNSVSDVTETENSLKCVNGQLKLTSKSYIICDKMYFDGDFTRKKNGGLNNVGNSNAQLLCYFK